MSKFQKSLKTGNQKITDQIKEFSADIEKGWINRDANKQFEVTFVLKFKEQEGGDIKGKSDISFVTDKTKDTVEFITSDQPDLL